MLSNHTWSPRNIYLYLVCLVTLILVIFATVEVVKAVVELAYPEPVWDATTVAKPIVPPSETPAQVQVDEAAELRQREIQRQWSQRNSLLNLVRNIAMFLVATPIYVYHWRRIERASR
jgi:hypothetical protein